MPLDPVRNAAIDVLLRVFDRGMHLDDALDITLRRKTDLGDRGRRFLTQLVYGTVRHKLLCEHVLRPLLRQPFEELPMPIRAILCMGVFQALFCSQVTFPAMVHTAVELAKKRGHAGTARLVNAVLRRAPQAFDALDLPARDARPADHLSLRHSMPPWLVERWIAEYGAADAERLCVALNTPAPATIRVNTAKATRDQVARYLLKAGFQVTHGTPVPEELTLPEIGALLRSKWFLRGYFMPQDPASMLAAHLVEPQPGERILDMCAAPGGKTTHLAQLAGPTARIVAMDESPGRLQAVLENAERLELPGIAPICGDGRRSPLRGPFDRVLVDAPCSGLGTLRRHPDLKWRVTPETIHRLARTQRDLLRTAAALCKNGGLVVYTVCTITPEETWDVAKAVLAEGAVAAEDGPAWLEPWRVTTGQYRTLPQDAALDGFFLMRFRKRS
ncbi:MAG TPA: 16S rRNA (cytosine(967)-C(5))-methyltransferase RsmB [Candidatus Hydrogenedentes bacterium]|nr:16S rRNA (cytosine(967)-C(5))-methyltransferase RsmB [Candidatus Hydrogenedentota bacterium]